MAGDDKKIVKLVEKGKVVHGSLDHIKDVVRSAPKDKTPAQPPAPPQKK